MDNSAINTLVFHEMFSPLPIPSGFSSVDDLEDSDIIELYTGGDRGWDGEQHTLGPTGETWSVKRSAIAAAYRAEMMRITDVGNSLADSVVMFVRHGKSLFGIDGLQVRDRDALNNEDSTAHFSRRTNAAIRRAVEAAGKDPNPFGPLIFNRTFWHAAVQSFLTYLNASPRRVAWVSPVFIAAFSAALKEFGPEWVSSRKPIILRYRMRKLTDLPNYIVATNDFLASQDEMWDISAYSETADFLERLCGGAEVHAATREVSALFVKGEGSSCSTCVSIGLEIPGPMIGCRVELATGATVELPRPPWAMGQMIKPKR